MMTNYEKLVGVLREIFQIDQADLDFGIYRIMNQKREEINDFLENKLLKQVNRLLEEANLGDVTTVKKELEDKTKQAHELGVDPDNVPRIKELKTQLQELVPIEVLEEDIFSHLASFFKRYYDKGDFISLRRYKKDVYAIPYEGEEVKLYWANHDQYYIKTSEYLKNYQFKIGEKLVKIELVDANTEQNNNKAPNGKERQFRIHEANPLAIEDDTLILYFTYLPNETKQKREQLNQQAFQVIQEQLPQEWREVLFVPSSTTKQKGRTLLEKHINDFTARHTFDYFIHKDLGGFLRRELDFYIKNEVLHIDDIGLTSTKVFTRQLAKIKALKAIALKIITLLDQIENFQKRLWLKKKFVVETNYCITLDKIPETYYEEIAQNEAQWEEWERLFSISEAPQDLMTGGDNQPDRLTILKHQPFLVLDTKFFSKGFQDRLLGEFENLDEQLNGLLINSENFQALKLLQKSHKENIKCIHIDPPYNTKTSGFLYKNGFKHSSWLSMMNQVNQLAIPLLELDGSFMSHIDEYEKERLHLVLEQQGDTQNSGTLIWDKGSPVTGAYGLAIQHEYTLFRSRKNILLKTDKQNIKKIDNKVRSLLKKYGAEEIEQAISQYRKWLRETKDLSKSEKIYNQFDNNGTIFRSADMGATDRRTNDKFYIPLIHPSTLKECPVPPFGWRYSPETLNKLLKENLILFGKDHTTIPRKKILLNDNPNSQLPSVYKSGYRGKLELDNLNIEFPFAHSTRFYQSLINSSFNNNSSIILDYFAGSGTTGHTVINLNREDEGNRKYILVEMGEYFNSATKPRIQKVIYSKDWKAGKPVSREGSSHIFKYIRLESYEDTLNNLHLLRDPKANDLFAEKEREVFYEEYLLGYMLDVESKGSLLSVKDFTDPFSYQLHITENNEPKLTTIDLVETFNYLIGLQVNTIKTIEGFRVVTGIKRTGEKTLVIWRNQTEKDDDTVCSFFQNQGWHQAPNTFDHVYLNGDSTLANLQQEGDTWKVFLTEQVFMQRMFDTKDV